MTGLQYYRLLRGMTQEELAQKANLVGATVNRIEIGFTKNPIASTLLALAIALDCSIEELRREYPDDALASRMARNTRITNEGNVVLAYKNSTRATFASLGKILHLSHEGARMVCKHAKAKDKHVLRLAEYEKTSVQKLLDTYLPGV